MTVNEKREVPDRMIEKENTNNVDASWITLSLLIALLAIIVNLADWQLGFVSVILIGSLPLGNHKEARNQFDKRRSRRKRK